MKKDRSYDISSLMYFIEIKINTKTYEIQLANPHYLNRTSKVSRQ